MGDFKMVDTMIKDGLWDAFNGYHMGNTAENVAKQWQITRQHAGRIRGRLAEQGRSRAEGRQVQGRDRPRHHQDPQGRRRWSTPTNIPSTAPRSKSIAKLRPAFDKEGTVTAANASGINDGAAAVVLMKASEAAKLGKTPLARIVSWAQAGVDPAIMGTGPIPASRAALKKAGWKNDDLDLIEANEAFAAQACAVNKDLGWDTSKVNVNGGAIAIGHPIGASGARVLVTLLLRDAEARRQEGPCHALHRRRHGHRHVRGALNASCTCARIVVIGDLIRVSTEPAAMPAQDRHDEENAGRGRHGTRCVGHGRNARHRRRDLQGAEGGRLQGRRHLSRQ